MADKNIARLGSGMKPVPMKLFATWEVEKTSPNCIPRLCSLTLTRLVVLNTLENDVSSIIVAVKMQNSKRILRSNEIQIPASGLVDTELDLSFSLQYPHFLKRDVNKLHILLQRRKKYKNRTILGYKTLAVGQVNMAQVLQRTCDKELSLYSNVKEHSNVVAKVMILSLSSQPVDHEENGHRKPLSSDMDRSPDIDNYSDEEEAYSSNEELSDSEPMMLEDETGRPRSRKPARLQLRSIMSRQRNFKQKFSALLKRFKVTEEALDSEPDHELVDTDQNTQDIDELFEELENLSDSDPDLDNMSVISTPKPSLRPFFSGGRSLLREAEKENIRPEEGISKRNSDIDINTATDRVTITTPVQILVNNSQVGSDTDLEPRKALLEQLKTVLGESDDRLPDMMMFVNAADWQGQYLVQKLQDKHIKAVSTCSSADVRACINALVNRIQKFCNSNSRTPKGIKVVLAGGDGYMNTVLRSYVEQFSNKSPDWQTYINFYVIPFASSNLARYLASVDNSYSSLFMDYQWKESFEKLDSPKLDAQELFNRISRYLHSAGSLVHIPIAEAMVTCKSKSSEEESAQAFIPFISEVRIGAPEIFNTSVDFEETPVSSPSPVIAPSSSPPPASSGLMEKVKEGHTPPSSPVVNMANPLVSQAGSEFLDLQVDYWTVHPKTEPPDKEKGTKKDSTKSTLKTAFRMLHVNRLPPSPDGAMPMVIVTKEKKQKIMKFGKKSKDVESKREAIVGINRLICTSKGQSHALRVSVDGNEWTGVKFFQLSSQWQTHIKTFPVAMISPVETLC